MNQKEGLDYFPMECVTDENIKLITAEFGLQAFAIIVKIYQMIYSHHGYYCEWNEEVVLLFTQENGLGRKKVSSVNEILLCCMRRGVFSFSQYEQNGILTSKKIQEIFLAATHRRKKVEMKKAYLLVKVAHLSENVCILDENVDILNGNVITLEQSKVKESKVNTYFDSEKVNDAFAAYLAMRERSAPVPGSKIVNLIEQLNTFKDKGCSDDELVEIVKEATSKGWMNFYKSDKKKPEQSKANFTERNYSKDDMESLERKLLMRR